MPLQPRTSPARKYDPQPERGGLHHVPRPRASTTCRDHVPRLRAAGAQHPSHSLHTDAHSLPCCVPRRQASLARRAGRVISEPLSKVTRLLGVDPAKFREFFKQAPSQGYGQAQGQGHEQRKESQRSGSRQKHSSGRRRSSGSSALVTSVTPVTPCYTRYVRYTYEAQEAPRLGG